MTTAAIFMAAVEGITANHVAKAMNEQTRGINWMGCSKGRMAEEYENANDTSRMSFGREALRSLDLVKLAAQAKARAAGDHQWEKVTGVQPAPYRCNCGDTTPPEQWTYDESNDYPRCPTCRTS